MNIPDRLYKYESLNLRTLQNIKGQILYFGSPLGFNDPYDCALTPNIVTPSDNEVDSIRMAYLADERLTMARRYELLSKTTQELRDMFQRSAELTITKYKDDFLKLRGVTCFTERNDDLLMWSHYGGMYKGICLEFDTSTSPFEKISPVKYSSSLPTLNLSQLLLGHAFEQVWQLFCTKSESWSYEREWRAFHATAGTQYNYPSETLTGVYFGPDIDNESLEIVCLVLAGQNEAVRYYKGERSATEYRVEFKEFTYMSYLQAKKQGLRT